MQNILYIKKYNYICHQTIKTMIHLINQTHSYHFSQKTSFDVSTRDDFEYNLRLKSDWQFRIYSEMLYRKSMGYNSYFFTLTYNDSHLPHIDYEYKYFDGTSKVYSSSCFNNEDLRYFTTTLRNELLRLHQITDISYIICPEFGKTNTIRPHYHGILCVPNKVSAVVLLELVKKCWSRPTNMYLSDGSPIRDSLGWVLPDKAVNSENNGKVQKPFQIDEKQLASTAIYVSKYCTKQVEFFNKPTFKYIIKQVKSVQSAENDELKKYLSNCVPRIKVSLHFGECINDMVTYKSLWWKPYFKVSEIWYDTLHFGVWTPLCKKKPTRIPFYNRRKLLFERIKESCVVSEVPCETKEYCKQNGLTPPKPRYTYDTKLSRLGEMYLPYEYQLCLNERTKYYEDVSSTLFSKEFADWCKDNNVSHLRILSLYSSTASASLATYEICYQDRVSPLHYADFLLHPDKYIPNNVVDKTKIVGSHRNGFNIDYDVKHDYRFPVLSLPPNVPLGLPTPSYFYGNESIDEMCKRAKCMYLLRAENISMPNSHISAPHEYFNIHFNSFPCFYGFDELILALKRYKRFKLLPKVEGLQKREEIKKCLIDKFWGNGF